MPLSKRPKNKGTKVKKLSVVTMWLFLPRSFIRSFTKLWPWRPFPFLLYTALISPHSCLLDCYLIRYHHHANFLVSCNIPQSSISITILHLQQPKLRCQSRQATWHVLPYGKIIPFLYCRTFIHGDLLIRGPHVLELLPHFIKHPPKLVQLIIWWIGFIDGALHCIWKMKALHYLLIPIPGHKLWNH
jgi:hypothetical protein